MIRNIRVGLAAACVASTALLWPSPAAAQHHGHGRVGVGVFVGGPAFYPYYNPFYWGWYGFGWYPPYPYPYPPYGYWAYDDTGSARLQVKPKETEVYVDGYFVGRVDDFDGTLQRLHIEAGEHELQLYLDGYQTVSEKVLFRRGATLKVSHTMQPLAQGASSVRPTPAPGAAVQPGPRQGPPAPVRRRDEQSGFGSVSIRVQPVDAEILVDGERWEVSEGSNRIEIELADGAHRIEIRKEGYRPYTANIRIRSGQAQTLNVSLSRDQVQELR